VQSLGKVIMQSLGKLWFGSYVAVLRLLPCSCSYLKMDQGHRACLPRTSPHCLAESAMTENSVPIF
jgi:hypothetical protein